MAPSAHLVGMNLPPANGVNLDSFDHRAHVVLRTDRRGRSRDALPRAVSQYHPVKIPQIDFRCSLPRHGQHRSRAQLRRVLPHVDFWNTWDQELLVSLVRRCLPRTAVLKAVSDRNAQLRAIPGCHPAHCGTCSPTARSQVRHRGGAAPAAGTVIRQPAPPAPLGIQASRPPRASRRSSEAGALVCRRDPSDRKRSHP